MSDIDWKARAGSWERTANTLSAHLRIQLVGQALSGMMLGFSVDTLGSEEATLVAKAAFLLADAMLEEAKRV